MITALLCAFLALLAIAVTTLQAVLTVRFRKTFVPVDPGRRFVSILKPVCGLDDELEENLLSFVRLEGIRYEVIISAEKWSEPALQVVRQVMAAYPAAPFRVVVGPGSRAGVVNRKVERLIAAMRVARGEILLVSDSNVRVGPYDLARTISAFADPGVGCVSNLFTGSGARGPGATLESLHLLGFVVPGTVLAASARVPCVVGKSMAISRRACEAIGGFDPFVRLLAEDQAIALAVRKAGFDVVLSPVVVRNVVVSRTIRQALDRQVRWNKIRYAFSRWLYICEWLTNPFPLAVCAAAASSSFLFLPLLVLAARCLQLAVLNRAARAGLSWRQVVCVPLLDLLMAWAWFVPFVSNRVTWRGYAARIGRNTELVQQAA